MAGSWYLFRRKAHPAYTATGAPGVPPADVVSTEVQITRQSITHRAAGALRTAAAAYLIALPVPPPDAPLLPQTTIHRAPGPSRTAATAYWWDGRAVVPDAAAPAPPIATAVYQPQLASQQHAAQRWQVARPGLDAPTPGRPVLGHPPGPQRASASAYSILSTFVVPDAVSPAPPIATVLTHRADGPRRTAQTAYGLAGAVPPPEVQPFLGAITHRADGAKRAAGAAYLITGAVPPAEDLPRGAVLIVSAYPVGQRAAPSVYWWDGRLVVPDVVPAVPPPFNFPVSYYRLPGWAARTAYELQGALLPGVPVPDVGLDLLEALIQFLDAHPTLPAAFGSSVNTPKFFSDEVPVGTAVPYLVIYDNDDEMMDDFMSKKDDGTTPYLTELDLQISVFHTSKFLARSLAWSVVDAINDSTITFTRGTLIHFRMVRQRTDLDPDPGPDGSNVWQRTLFVHAVVQRTL